MTPMHIAKLKIRNFLCYAGEHEINLEPTVYAISARHVNNPGRSNWLGKSGFMNAIRFVLYGTHPRERDDEWITEGEKIGEVSVELSDGAIITRRREVGRSTRLWFWPAPESKGAVQEEAQTAIEKHLGLEESDFMATCYFEQKAMARFINQRPGERMAMVSGWLRLKPLEDAEALIRSYVDETMVRLDKSTATIATYDEQIKQAFGDFKDVGEMREEREGMYQDFVTANEKLEECHAKISINEANRADHARHAEYQQLVAMGKELAGAHKSGDGIEAGLTSQMLAAKDREKEKFVELREVQGRVKHLSVLARGEFDGKCPVDNDIACPARAKINDRIDTNKSGLQGAEAEYERVKRDLVGVEEATATTVKSLQQWQGRESQLEELRRRAQALKLQKAHKAPETPVTNAEALRIEFNEAKAVAQEFQALLSKMDSAIAFITATTSARAEEVKSRDFWSERLGTLREAGIIFGKSGAQRRLAEDALAEIESDANDLMAMSGIDLTVRVQWSRAADGLAGACDACGWPFPSSTKVKECKRCSAARGPKTVNKLDIILSNRSGAADDLAGGAVQLAASSWLRRDRSADWGVAMIDEPFGALDDANRKAFGGHLATMLRGQHGFQQAFVIAHHAAVLDALPAKIEILSDGTHAKIERVG